MVKTPRAMKREGLLEHRKLLELLKSSPLLLSGD